MIRPFSIRASPGLHLEKTLHGFNDRSWRLLPVAEQLNAHRANLALNAAHLTLIESASRIEDQLGQIHCQGQNYSTLAPSCNHHCWCYFLAHFFCGSRPVHVRARPLAERSKLLSEWIIPVLPDTLNSATT